MYRTVDTNGDVTATRGAKTELYNKIARYVFVRAAVFFVSAIALGFVPGLLLDDAELVCFSSSRPLDHMILGSISTLACAGGWALIQLYAHLGFWTRVVNNPWRTFGGGRGKKSGDGTNSIVLMLVAVGACYLIYHLAIGIYELTSNGRAAAGASLRNTNREMREEIARRYRVVNYREDAPIAQPEID